MNELQVLEDLAETCDRPPAIRQIAAPALSLCSLFVVVFAWYHGDRGTRSVSRPEFALLPALPLPGGAGHGG